MLIIKHDQIQITHSIKFWSIFSGIYSVNSAALQFNKANIES